MTVWMGVVDTSVRHSRIGDIEKEELRPKLRPKMRDQVEGPS